MNGVIVVDKAKGNTSFDEIRKIRKEYNIKKVGHTGTLDPLAEGVLIVTLGGATKVAELLTAEDKEYVAGVLLGIETDTLDITGKVTKHKPVDLTKDIEKVVNSYQKIYLQEVPIYSAIKVNGKKLYEYARNNEKVELPETVTNILNVEKTEDTQLQKAIEILK